MGCNTLINWFSLRPARRERQEDQGAAESNYQVHAPARQRLRICECVALPIMVLRLAVSENTARCAPVKLRTCVRSSRRSASVSMGQHRVPVRTYARATAPVPFISLPARNPGRLCCLPARHFDTAVLQ